MVCSNLRAQASPLIAARREGNKGCVGTEATLVETTSSQRPAHSNWTERNTESTFPWSSEIQDSLPLTLRGNTTTASHTHFTCRVGVGGSFLTSLSSGASCLVILRVRWGGSLTYLTRGWGVKAGSLPTWPEGGSGWILYLPELGPLVPIPVNSQTDRLTPLKTLPSLVLRTWSVITISLIRVNSQNPNEYDVSF